MVTVSVLFLASTARFAPGLSQNVSGSVVEGWGLLHHHLFFSWHSVVTLRDGLNLFIVCPTRKQKRVVP
uniref:Putative secreted protein n=1 Tax=Ixodes scapularis TaxID=6945 RepID=A0A4D5RYV4_IXOSC